MKRFKPIKIDNSPIVVEGPMSYDESTRAKGMLRFRKEIVAHFSDIRGRNKIVRYRVELFKDSKSFSGRTRELIKQGKIVPMLLFLLKEE